ncbi:SRPBCC domain-containing protein [Leifsonia sp. 2TAF2]|uniref:SRPBCC family protein n=1 Tax=Leifsonia sp. 2TAF2 TaxID=3233009 RepID=UPI003F952A07
METIERIIPAPVDTVWRLWTTPEGIAQWWAPDGFRTDVSALELRPGGELVYTMTAIAPEMVAFMEQSGMPLSTESRKVFTELDEPTRIAYRSLIDFVPDHAPYEQLTVVDLVPTEEGTRVVMQAEPLHDEVWTERLVAGRANELENLARLVG